MSNLAFPLFLSFKVDTRVQAYKAWCSPCGVQESGSNCLLRGDFMITSQRWGTFFAVEGSQQSGSADWNEMLDPLFVEVLTRGIFFR